MPEHHEVLGDTGVYFSRTDDDDLRAKMQMLLDNPEIVRRRRRIVVQRVRERYSWNRVAEQYEKLFKKVANVKI